MNLQSCETNNLGQKNHFNVIFMVRSKVYHKEEIGGLLPSLRHVKIMSSREVNSIFINHFHYLICVNDLFMTCECVTFKTFLHLSKTWKRIERRKCGGVL